MLDVLMGMATGSAFGSSLDADGFVTLGGRRTQAGVNVSEETAMRYVTVYACVSKRAKTIATLPVSVIEKTGLHSRKQVEHPLADLLNGQANQDSLGLTVRETMMANLDLWGNAYTECVWTQDRRTILELIPLMSRYIEPKRDEDGKLVYIHNPPGEAGRVIPQDRMWHIPGLSFNGITGLSPIGLNRETIGLGIATVTLASSFFGNGAWPGAIIKRDSDKSIGVKPLSREAGAKLVADLEEKLQGADKAFGIALLRDGMELQQMVSMPLKEAQFVEIRKLTRIDILGIFDVPPSKIHDMEHGTFNNSEQEDISWVKDSIRPSTVRIEQSAKAKFFPDQPLFLRHNLDGLLRGDLKTRYTAYSIGRQWGWLSINEVREKEEMNPIEGGDEHLTPLNMAVVGQAQPLTVTGPPPADDGGASEQLLLTSDCSPDVFRPLVADAANRIATKELMAVGKAMQRLASDGNTAKCQTWVDKFYSQHVEFITQCLTPIADAFHAATGRDMPSPSGVAAAYAEVDHSTVTAIVEDPVRMSSLLAAWKQDKAETIAGGIMELLKDSMIAKPQLIEKE